MKVPDPRKPTPAPAGEGGAHEEADVAGIISGRPGVVRVRPPSRGGDLPALGGAASPAPGSRRVPLSRARSSTALRMAESKREAPHLYLETSVDVALAAALADESSVAFPAMVLKACAEALALHPGLNARFAGDAIEIFEEINLACAVALEDGLVWPVLRAGDRLPLAAVSALYCELDRRSRSGELDAEDLSRATFSVMDVGGLGIEKCTAVIQPPQAAILAVGAIIERPVIRGGRIAFGPVVSLTLSGDHRLVDVVAGAAFLAEVRRRLEEPRLLLGSHV